LAGINWTSVHKLNAREMEDREHFGKMRETLEARLSGEEAALIQEPACPVAALS